MMRRLCGWMMLLGLAVLSVACATKSEPVVITGEGAAGAGLNPSGPRASSAPVYTAYNVWYEKADNVYSENYHLGAMIPAGTQVTNIAIKREHNPKIAFTTVPGGATYTIEFVTKHHPGVTVDAFMGRLFTSKNLFQLTEGFTAEERDAIRTGEIRVGMSKRALLVAYGYPIETYTPSLQSSRWTYMENRFRRKEIGFDANGTTTLGGGTPGRL